MSLMMYLGPDGLARFCFCKRCPEVSFNYLLHSGYIFFILYGETCQSTSVLIPLPVSVKYALSPSALPLSHFILKWHKYHVKEHTVTWLICFWVGLFVHFFFFFIFCFLAPIESCLSGSDEVQLALKEGGARS